MFCNLTVSYPQRHKIPVTSPPTVSRFFPIIHSSIYIHSSLLLTHQLLPFLFAFAFLSIFLSFPFYSSLFCFFCSHLSLSLSSFFFYSFQHLPILAGKDGGSDSSITTIDTKLNRRESHMNVKRRNSTAPNVLFNFTSDSETSLVFERDPDVR